MSQLDLFENTNTPKTVLLYPNFITESEESGYLEHFEKIRWQSIKMHGVIARRQVAHYGLDYTYTKRSVTDTIPAPEWLNGLTTRAAGLIEKTFDDIKEILVTAYPPGAGIGWHKDAEVFGNAIVGVSFLSDCTMKFKNPETGEVYKLFIPRRSAYVFADEARWLWHHSIANHPTKRYSVTFRTLVTK